MCQPRRRNLHAYDLTIEIARLYGAARSSFVELVEGDGEWATRVPCNPDWTVSDVLSHVAGVTFDIAEGNVEGAATDPWTAVQVERWRDTPRADAELDAWFVFGPGQHDIDE